MCISGISKYRGVVQDMRSDDSQEANKEAEASPETAVSLPSPAVSDVQLAPQPSSKVMTGIHSSCSSDTSFSHL